ncbi:hypothetical protein C8F01DRAFT_1378875 [Mycena amicta]|nr:hypothetical protein C8F01DRAFT_1378875 [Mycena amicta]
MKTRELIAWIWDADADIQSAVITDVCWWAETYTVLKHQFIVLRFGEYELVLERAGKALSDLSRVAVDRCTFRVKGPKDYAFEREHTLLFALLTSRSAAPLDAWCDKAFVDFLDVKWRGPHLTLLDIATYAQGISSEETYYSLGNANCHWFARMVFHTIALRHYSFPLIASHAQPTHYVYKELPKGPIMVDDTSRNFSYHDWRVHDPSSSGLVFRFLRSEEWANGGLLWRRTVILAAVLFALGCIAGVLVGGFIVIRGIAPMLLNLPEFVIIITMFATAIGVVAVIYTVCLKAAPVMVRGGGVLLSRLARRRTTRVLSKFDKHADPESIRGDYDLAPIPYINIPNPEPWEPPGHRVWVLASDVREMPKLWAHDKQIFVDVRAEYFAAFAALQDLPAGQSPVASLGPPTAASSGPDLARRQSVWLEEKGEAEEEVDEGNGF